MAFDFKKEYKAFYLPKTTPEIISVPKMNYIAVHGTGDPNEEGGDYQTAIGLLYGVAYTIRMAKKGGHEIEGYFDYVVPPLEGFWSQSSIQGVDYSRKEDFRWTSVIRLPDFVKEADFRWALSEAAEKKHQDFSRVEFLTLEEGLTVQCMHIGSYDDEPATVELMHAYIEQRGCVPDFSDTRLHHEIYLSDPRRVAPQKRKTVIRHPIRKQEE